MQVKNSKIVCTQEHTKLQVIISQKCESKIRTVCQVFPDREWSGAAFYNVKYLNGKNADTAVLPNDIALEVVDFMLQDIGNAVYTEYDLNEEVAGYIADNLDELLGTKVALLHSHNNMSCFLSGTDLDTLNEKTEECNNVLTIVVNNAGTYIAKFTQKVLATANSHTNLDKIPEL